MSRPIPSQRSKARRLKRPTKVTPARWAAWLTVHRTFDEDAWTDRAFTGVVEQLGLDSDPRERAFAQRLAYGVVQQAKRLDHVIATLGKRPLHKLDPPVLHALRIGVYELLELQQATGPGGERLGSSSAHAAVDQAVELVRGVVGERAVAFTNAILRRAQVDGAGILDKLDPTDEADLATMLSMPQWLVARVRANHGEDGVAALAAQNEPTATSFRVNPLGGTALDAIDAGERLTTLGVELATPLFGRAAAPHSLEVTGPTAALSPLVEDGTLVPQSLASQFVATALDPHAGDRILDMCAAPGGKATHLATLVGIEGEVVAVELHDHRADSIRALAQRTRTADVIRVQVGDATELDPAVIGTFDRVLVDAPCSGTGVLAARPDARWKRTEEGIDELVALQSRLLAVAATLVKPGGVVVYSTCSILREEDEAIAEAAPVTLVPDALPEVLAKLATSSNTARTWPQRDHTDGFFIARFRRQEAGA